MTHKPKDLTIGISYNHLASFLKKIELAVGEVVRNQFRTLHAVWLETVARLHGTNGERKYHQRGIKAGTERFTADDDITANGNA